MITIIIIIIIIIIIQPILISQVPNTFMRVLVLVRYNLTVVTKRSVLSRLVTAIIKIFRGLLEVGINIRTLGIIGSRRRLLIMIITSPVRGKSALPILFIKVIVYIHIRATIMLSLVAGSNSETLHVIILSKLLTSTRYTMESILKIGGHYTTIILLRLLTSILHHISAPMSNLAAQSSFRRQIL